MTIAASDGVSRATSAGARHAKVPRGLYAVTDPVHGATVDLASHVERAIQGGARMVQYRDKTASHKQRHERAATLKALCARYRVPLIINDDVALARAVKAGVHLGREDLPLAQARVMLGEHAIIGVSCYNDFLRAEQAWKAGADYIAFGSFFQSPSKPDAVRATLDLLMRAHAQSPIPVCAIGGIIAVNATLLIRAGADLVAVISGVFGQPDHETAAREIADLFDT